MWCEQAIFTAKTSGATTTQSLTISGTETPKLVLLVVLGATGINVSSANLRSGFGLWDGTTGRALSIFSDNGQSAATHDVGMRYTDDGAAVYMSLGTDNTLDGKAVFSSWINSGGSIGVEIDWNDGTSTNYPATAYRIAAIFFGGSDFSAAVVDHMSSTTLNGTNSISGLAFQPKAGFFISPFFDFGTNQSTDNARLSIGMFANDATLGITQACYSVFDRHQPSGTVSGNAQSLYNNRIGSRSFVNAALTTNTDQGQLEVTAFNSGGIDITLRGVGGQGMGGMYALMTFPGRAAVQVPAIDTSSASPSAGTRTVTPGYQAKAIFALNSGLENADIGSLVTTKNCNYSFGLYDTTGASACSTWVTNDNSTTSRTGSRFSTPSIAQVVSGLTGAVTCDVDIDTIGATSFDINVPTLAGVDYRIAFFTIGTETVEEVIVGRVDAESTSSLPARSDRLVSLQTLDETAASLATRQDRFVSIQDLDEATSSLSAKRDAGASCLVSAESVTTLPAYRDCFASAIVSEDSYAVSPIEAARLLVATDAGSSESASILLRSRQVEAVGTAETSSSLASRIDRLLTARLVGEALAEVPAVVDRLVSSSTLAETLALLAMTESNTVMIEGSTLGEVLSQLVALRSRGVIGSELGLSESWFVAERSRIVEAADLAETVATKTLRRDQLISVRDESSAYELLSLLRELGLSAANLDEASYLASLLQAGEVAISGNSAGESLASLPLLVSLGLAGIAASESSFRARSGVAWGLSARLGAESAVRAAATRTFPVEGRTQGVVDARAPLLRSPALSASSTSEAGTRAEMVLSRLVSLLSASQPDYISTARRDLGLTGRSEEEAAAAVAALVERVLTARTAGELFETIILGDASETRYRTVIEVSRDRRIFVIARSPEGIEVVRRQVFFEVR